MGLKDSKNCPKTIGELINLTVFVCVWMHVCVLVGGVVMVEEQSIWILGGERWAHWQWVCCWT